MNAKDFIQELRTLQEKIRKIENSITDIEKERDREKTKFSNLHECKENKERLFSVTLEEFVNLIPKENQPEVISVWNSSGNRIILLRSPKIPEFAFPIWNFKDNRIKSTRYRISLNINGTPSCKFSIICACCFHSVESIIEGETQEDKKKRVGEEFQKALVPICNHRNIHVLFIRRPEDWKHCDLIREHGIELYDANDYMKIMNNCYSKDMIKRAFSFILWENSTLIHPDKYVIHN